MNLLVSQKCWWLDDSKAASERQGERRCNDSQKHIDLQHDDDVIMVDACRCVLRAVLVDGRNAEARLTSINTQVGSR